MSSFECYRAAARGEHRILMCSPKGHNIVLISHFIPRCMADNDSTESGKKEGRFLNKLGAGLKDKFSNTQNTEENTQEQGSQSLGNKIYQTVNAGGPENTVQPNEYKPPETVDEVNAKTGEADDDQKKLQANGATGSKPPTADTDGSGESTDTYQDAVSTLNDIVTENNVKNEAEAERMDAELAENKQRMDAQNTYRNALDEHKVEEQAMDALYSSDPERNRAIGNGIIAYAGKHRDTVNWYNAAVAGLRVGEAAAGAFAHGMNTIRSLTGALISGRPMSIASTMMTVGLVQQADFAKRQMDKVGEAFGIKNGARQEDLVGTIRGAQYYRKKEEMDRAMQLTVENFGNALESVGLNGDFTNDDGSLPDKDIAMGRIQRAMENLDEDQYLMVNSYLERTQKAQAQRIYENYLMTGKLSEGDKYMLELTSAYLKPSVKQMETLRKRYSKMGREAGRYARERERFLEQSVSGSIRDINRQRKEAVTDEDYARIRQELGDEAEWFARRMGWDYGKFANPNNAHIIASRAKTELRRDAGLTDDDKARIERLIDKLKVEGDLTATERELQKNPKADPMLRDMAMAGLILPKHIDDYSGQLRPSAKLALRRKIVDDKEFADRVDMFLQGKFATDDERDKFLGRIYPSGADWYGKGYTELSGSINKDVLEKIFDKFGKIPEMKDWEEYDRMVDMVAGRNPDTAMDLKNAYIKSRGDKPDDLAYRYMWDTDSSIQTNIADNPLSREIHDILEKNGSGKRYHFNHLGIPTPGAVKEAVRIAELDPAGNYPELEKYMTKGRNAAPQQQTAAGTPATAQNVNVNVDITGQAGITDEQLNKILEKLENISTANLEQKINDLIKTVEAQAESIGAQMMSGDTLIIDGLKKIYDATGKVKLDDKQFKELMDTLQSLGISLPSPDQSPDEKKKSISNTIQYAEIMSPVLTGGFDDESKYVLKQICGYLRSLAEAHNSGKGINVRLVDGNPQAVAPVQSEETEEEKTERFLELTEEVVGAITKGDLPDSLRAKLAPNPEILKKVETVTEAYMNSRSIEMTDEEKEYDKYLMKETVKNKDSSWITNGATYLGRLPYILKEVQNHSDQLNNLNKKQWDKSLSDEDRVDIKKKMENTQNVMRDKIYGLLLPFRDLQDAMNDNVKFFPSNIRQFIKNIDPYLKGDKTTIFNALSGPESNNLIKDLSDFFTDERNIRTFAKTMKILDLNKEDMKDIRDLKHDPNLPTDTQFEPILSEESNWDDGKESNSLRKLNSDAAEKVAPYIKQIDEAGEYAKNWLDKMADYLNNTGQTIKDTGFENDAKMYIDDYLNMITLSNAHATRMGYNTDGRKAVGRKGVNGEGNNKFKVKLAVKEINDLIYKLGIDMEPITDKTITDKMKAWDELTTLKSPPRKVSGGQKNGGKNERKKESGGKKGETVTGPTVTGKKKEEEDKLLTAYAQGGGQKGDDDDNGW